MIRCNLSILLAERNMKISSLSDNTGLSRTTLTSLVNNRCQGIQLSTLNTLCSFLKVKPDDIISYYPMDIITKYRHISKEELNQKIEYTGVFDAKMWLPISNFTIEDIFQVNITVVEITTGNFNINARISMSDNVGDIFEKLPMPFSLDIQDILKNQIRKEYSNEYVFSQDANLQTWYIAYAS